MYVDKSGGRPRPWNDHALESMGRALQNMQGLTQAASAGGFAINEAGGQALLAAVRSFRTELDGQRGNLAAVSQPPRLGDSPGARLVAPHVQRSATGDARSLDAVVQQATAALDEFEAAVRQAMANYRDTEAGNRQSLQGSYRG